MITFVRGINVLIFSTPDYATERTFVKALMDNWSTYARGGHWSTITRNGQLVDALGMILHVIGGDNWSNFFTH
jgi:hypothetical protein